MSTRITKSCPHCGTAYDSSLYSGRPSKGNQTCYGSPIRQCGKCKNYFIDNNYREIAISGPRGVDKMWVSPQTMVYGGIGIVMGLASLYFHLWWGIIFLLYGLILIIGEASGHSKRIKMLEEEQRKSEERVKNPEYVLLLKQIGYNFPEGYFDNNQEV